MCFAMFPGVFTYFVHGLMRKMYKNFVIGKIGSDDKKIET